jgi:tetratricopeptide (TPR) repeat protein
MTSGEQAASPAPDGAFYVTGGTLRHDAPSYVERQADRSLYDALRRSEFCYLLTSRQMGKSSLMVRTAARLRAERVAVAVVDLTAVGQNLTTEQWYDGLLGQVGRHLDLEDEFEHYWQEHSRLGPLQRFMAALQHVALPRLRQSVGSADRSDPSDQSDPSHTATRLVVFIDEIDAVRSLPFPTDEFFAAMRECYNRRTQEPEWSRLTFCLLGVATPADLMRDATRTPFNLGQRIELTDFTTAEAAPLARGLGCPALAGEQLLGRAFYWTGGHPYLTQRLCQAVAARRAWTVDRLDALCQELFLAPRARERDDNLLFVRERLLRTAADLGSLLSLYDRVHRQERVADEETSALVSELLLSGITRASGGLLRVRNRIYYHVFDQEWVRANLPAGEPQPVTLRWQRRVRGAAPLVANSLSDAGDALLLCPDDAEHRLYHGLAISPDGHSQPAIDIVVEKVRKFELSASAEVMLGLTNNDLYLFRSGRRSRIFPDRRVLYADAVLARQGQLFACAFSDLLGDAHAVALGDTTGRRLWERPMSGPASRLGIAADGSILAAAGVGGWMLALDRKKAAIWELEQPEPVSALALGQPGWPCAAGTEGGGVFLVDREGGTVWRSSMGMPVVSVAVDTPGDCVAAVGRSTAGGRLACFGPTGHVIWDCNLDSQPNGVALSPDGRYLAVSLVDGRITCYESRVSAFQGDAAWDHAVAEAEALAERGELASACQRLRGLLDARPEHLAAADRLAGFERVLIEDRLAAARAQAEGGDYDGALSLLAEAQLASPFDETLFAGRRSLRQAAVDRLFGEARRYAGDGDLESARARLAELLRLDPAHRPAREQLAEWSQPPTEPAQRPS